MKGTNITIRTTFCLLRFKFPRAVIIHSVECSFSLFTYAIVYSVVKMNYFVLNPSNLVSLGN